MTTRLHVIYLVNGGWGQWSSYGKCSKPCGRGKQTRNRKCNAPAPSPGGEYCVGVGSQTRHCNTNSCCKDIWPSKKCKKQKRKCKKKKNVKKNCRKTCNLCSPRDLGNFILWL